MTLKWRVKVEYFLKSVLQLITQTHTCVDGVPSYLAQWLLMKRSLKPRFYIADMTFRLTSRSHLHKTYIQLIQCAPLSFLGRECSYLTEWLPMVSCLFDLILFISVNFFSVKSCQDDSFLGWTGTKQDLMILACHVYFLLPCGHLLGKGWPLGSLVRVFLCFCHLPIPYRVLVHAWYLIVSIPDLCLLLYFAQGQYAVRTVRLKPATPLSRLKHSTTWYCTRIVCSDYDESFRLLLWPWSKRSRSSISYKC